MLPLGACAQHTSLSSRALSPLSHLTKPCPSRLPHEAPLNSSAHTGHPLTARSCRRGPTRLGRWAATPAQLSGRPLVHQPPRLDRRLLEVSDCPFAVLSTCPRTVGTEQGSTAETEDHRASGPEGRGACPALRLSGCTSDGLLEATTRLEGTRAPRSPGRRHHSTCPLTPSLDLLLRFPQEHVGRLRTSESQHSP